MNFFKLNKKLVLFFLFSLFAIFLHGSSKIPVLDRDEARFASASKTMLEKEDFIDISIGEEKRYKKPIGIYWAQVLSNFSFGSYPYQDILIYRLPSIIAIFASFLLIFFYSTKNFDLIKASLTIFFLTFSILSISEMHQSKTDGMLFLFTNICNLTLLELIKSKNPSNKLKYLFWLSLGLGTIIKGPIIFIFTLLPLSIFSFICKRNFFKIFWSNLGILLFFVVVLPWFIIITIKSGNNFWYESVYNDLLKKVGSGQESHGFPPGYYTALLFIFLWPCSIFLISFCLLLKKNWKNKILRSKQNLFLFLWFIIPFLTFEIIFTKLPHYVFPSYTAICILISNFLIDHNFKNLKFITIPAILYPMILSVLFTYSITEFSEFDKVSIFILCVFIFFTLSLVYFCIKKKIISLIIFSGFFQLFFYFVLTNVLVSKLNSFWIANKISQIIEDNKNYSDEIYNYGFNEPSLYFMTSHISKKINPLDIPLENLQNKILLIITEEYSDILTKNLRFKEFEVTSTFEGYNYSRGNKLIFKIYKNY